RRHGPRPDKRPAPRSLVAGMVGSAVQPVHQRLVGPVLRLPGCRRRGAPYRFPGVEPRGRRQDDGADRHDQGWLERPGRISVPVLDAAALHADALIWDDHSGFEPSPAADLDQLERWRRAGVDYLSVNVGYD